VNARRTALIVIPVSIAIGIVAALRSNWPVLAFMVLSVAFQTANLVITRRRLGQRG
jgi:hypothetical protein